MFIPKTFFMIENIGEAVNLVVYISERRTLNRCSFVRKQLRNYAEIV